MVRLSQIYTKTGDDGTTGLGDGARVAKTDARVEAYGTVDEANALIGVCAVSAEFDTNTARTVGTEKHRLAIRDLLTAIQNDLFDVGADLCCPIDPKEAPGSRLRVSPHQTQRLEAAIDEHNERLAPLNSFILPGGSSLAAQLHVARTVVRRAERCTVALLGIEPARTNAETVRYLNRLSDLLFVLGRVANNDGNLDIKWIPGANR